MRAVERTRSVFGGLGVLAVALLPASGVGCGTLRHRGAEPPPAEPAPVVKPASAEAAPLAPPAATDFATLTRHLASTLTRAGASCPRIGYALDAWTAEHGGEYRAAIRTIDAWEAKADRDDVKAYYADLFDAIRVRVEAGSRCDADQGAREAFERFFESVGFVEAAKAR